VAEARLGWGGELDHLFQRSNPGTGSEKPTTYRYIIVFLKNMPESQTMIDPKRLDDLAQRVAGSLPSGLQVLKQDVERNLRAGLEAGLARLDLVTRDEFDIQSAVLERTRDKLSRLEQQVAELERLAGLQKPSQD
jgi:hypothetical protein